MPTDKIFDPYADREQVLYMNELHGKVAAAQKKYDRLRRKYVVLVRAFIKAVGVKQYRELIKVFDAAILEVKA